MALAIAIPSLVRARIAANESAAVGDLRSIVGAEATYSSVNGYYDKLDCLMAPGRCIPGGQGGSQPLLDQRLSTDVRNGYEFRFYPGPAPEPGTLTARSSPSSITSFAVLATPVTPGRSGTRAFCADDSGMICIMAPGASPSLSEAACPIDNCMPIGGR
jgi:type II secretory pathway pseudopilin PulG